MKVPLGFSMSGVHAGIKQDKTREDISLIKSESTCTAAGVYTQNKVVAAPVILDRQRTPAADIRGIVINSGNANACTGEQGEQDAEEMARLAAAEFGANPEQVLVLSTGIIGEPMPMPTIAAGIKTVASQLGTDEAQVVAAARGLMTTDTSHKIAVREIPLTTGEGRVMGFAKGAAMIGPNMATMLGVILTDVALSPDEAQQLLCDAVNDSFNCISVEGHMSTNDTVLLLSSNQHQPTDSERATLHEAIHDACIELARAIPNDGEGATHLIQVDVSGCRTRNEAHQIARTIADSALVKTAVTGADPNWGRIVSAAGYAKVDFDPSEVCLKLNGTMLYEAGNPVAFDAESVSASIRENRNTHIDFRLQQGDAAVTFWTCDLTTEYVHLNADYHT
ncbi:MAG: bifunctional ornithine acetyltransferase/N-acetylglutamate synthase [Planctomycetaceae bacterium]|nr:bifunctional ornithine acetyltransferase/N-acetylglutamate synthase [Planctomycetaceae bacterium]MBN02468.1 bifunctional ornithine acetyltransferase/N-acetylglutamate synthase [Planctomycetaceae bacterium]